jgi:uncharacterized protein YjiS (DUF1127 family)
MPFSAFNGNLSLSQPKSALEWLMLLLDRAKQRNDLSELTDFQLADIGLSRREAEREAGKWFWE